MDEKVYLCSHDGYKATNRASWCDLGCGRDYNQMIAVPKRHIARIQEQAAERVVKYLEDKCHYELHAVEGASGGPKDEISYYYVTPDEIEKAYQEAIE